VTGGNAIHRTNAGDKPLIAGDLLILAPGQAHAIEAPRDVRLYNVYYLSEWLLQDLPLREEAPQMCLLFLGQNLFPDKASPEPVHTPLPLSCLRQVEAELALLESLSRQPKPNTVLMRASLVKAFALLTDALAARLELEHQFITHPLVRHAMACIDRALDFGEPCSVVQWATSMNFSADYFSRRFRQLTGESPTTFYQRRRLQRAAQSLIRGSEPVSELAHRLGFTDNAHFSRVFRNSFQMSPSRYRKRFQL